MSEIAVVPETPSSGEELRESSTIRQMRAQIEETGRKLREAERVAAETAARAKALEDEKQIEMAQREQELAELQPLRAEHAKLVSAFQALYAEELAGIPEEKREAITRLSGAGEWPERLAALRAAKALLPSPSMPMGTHTNPTQRQDANSVPKLDPVRPFSLSEAFRVTPVSQSSIDSMGIESAIRNALQT